MTRKRPKILTTRVPLLSHKGSKYQPDLLLAVQDGQPRMACLSEKADVNKLIRTLEDVLEELKDIQWAARRVRK